MILGWIILFVITAVIIYHHFIYTAALVWLGKKRKNEIKEKHKDPLTFPRISLIMPAHNEEAYIEAKLANILMLDYPAEKLQVLICCDGCSDNTAEIIAQYESQFTAAGISLKCWVKKNNRGKLARLNELMTYAKNKTDIISLTDTSALISIDALKQVARNFENEQTGAITCSYLLASPSDGEKQYWQWQNNIRSAESQLGSVIGGNGAFYAMRSHLYSPLPEDTINDDFILPMMVLKQGFNVIFNQNINSVEIAPTSQNENHQRRQRIGAGNLQQLIRCQFVFTHKSLGVRWLFTSGKGLRTVMPFLFVGYFITSVLMALQGSILALAMVLTQLLIYGVASLPLINIHSKFIDKVHYIIGAYYSSLLGMLRYCNGQFTQGWRHLPPLSNYQTQSTQTIKRLSDIIFSCIGLTLTLPLWPFIAFAIKYDSSGPIFYRQIRVGQISETKVELFEIFKFRTMTNDAEKKSGAVWATKNDPRITHIGRFLRATRLDELPQFINVIRGDMSLIGPRPERPEMCGNLQNALPFYLERTTGLRPGLTGLAQVNSGYDNDLEDVKNKIAWDHAYAIALSSPIQWLRMDLYILFKTSYIMFAKRGQ